MASELELAAEAALETGRMMMEAGANAATVTAAVTEVATGLGAQRVDVRVGYASLAVTLASAEDALTRMVHSSAPGVDQELALALRQLVGRAAGGGMGAAEVTAEVRRLAGSIPTHGAVVKALAAGLACAVFARLLQADWSATGAVFAASTFGQAGRGLLHRRGVNDYITTALVSLAASCGAGWLARLGGSHTLPAALIASVLLLVPGIPALNAQSDILDGYPALGSARAMSVLMTLIFISAGLWFAGALVRPGQ